MVLDHDDLRALVDGEIGVSVPIRRNAECVAKSIVTPEPVAQRAEMSKCL